MSTYSFAALFAFMFGMIAPLFIALIAIAARLERIARALESAPHQHGAANGEKQL